MRQFGLICLILVVICACGAQAAPSPSPTPTPTATPLYVIGTEYTTAVNRLHDSTAADWPTYYSSASGSAAASTAAAKLATDYQTLLNNLDSISFPANAQSDLSTFRKTVVALQVFWSNVSVSDSSYSDLIEGSLNNDYNNAAILLGHDVGVSLVIEKPTPTPS